MKDQIQVSILVVDDDMLNLKVVCKRLEREGYTVAASDTGKRALELLEHETYDLVLLDIEMPGMDGYQVLERIKANDLTKNTPVIMVTATDNENSIMKCLEAGASDYMIKPFNMSLAANRIQSCLIAQSVTGVLDETHTKARPGKILVVDDDEGNRKILSKRLERNQHTVETAENGSVGLEKLEAGDFDLVLLDISMPVMGGEEMLKKIKLDRRLSKLPVIIISTDDDTDNMLRFLDLGATEFIAKPFNAASLNNRIARCLALQH